MPGERTAESVARQAARESSRDSRTCHRACDVHVHGPLAGRRGRASYRIPRSWRPWRDSARGRRALWPRIEAARQGELTETDVFACYFSPPALRRSKQYACSMCETFMLSVVVVRVLGALQH